MGNRFAGGIEPGAMPALHRYLGNPVLSWVGRLFFKVPINDFHCGMRGFSRDRILGLGLTTTGMEFASEMVVRSAIDGLTITEVPTTLKPDGRSREPHLRTWRDGWRHLRFLLAFSPRWLFLYPADLPDGGRDTVIFTWLAFGPVDDRIGHLRHPDDDRRGHRHHRRHCRPAGWRWCPRAYATSLGLLPRSPTGRAHSRPLHARVGPDRRVRLALLGSGRFLLAVLNWQETDFGRARAPPTCACRCWACC